MQTAESGLEEAGITHVFFLRKRTASGEGIETEGGMTVASDESLPRVVVGLSWLMKLLRKGKISWENGVRPRKSESMLFLKSSLA